MKHIAHSTPRLPHSEDWVAFNARIEVMQDIVATLMVSPCCTDEDVLHSLECIIDELYNLRDVADGQNNNA